MKRLQIIVIILMVLLSGSIRFFIDWGIVVVPFYVICCGLLFMRLPREVKYENISHVLLFLIPILHVLFIGRNLNSNLAFVCILFLLSGYLTIRSFNFFDFRDLWLKVVKVICVISIIVQLTHDLGIISPTGSFNGEILSTLYFFNCDWGEYRLASIYWEPGQFQIIILYTLCLFTDELYSDKSYKLLLRKYGILILALLLTQSTTGYIAFVVLILGYFMFPKGEVIPLWKRGVMIFFFIIVLVVLFFTNAVQEKLEQSQNMEQLSSTAIRVQDNMALISTIIDSPWIGHGLDTVELQSSLESYGSITSSNGWLYGTASYGLLYVLLLLFLLYRRITDFPKGIPPVFIFLSLFISQCNEYIIFFPYMLPYLYKFNQYVVSDMDVDEDVSIKNYDININSNL